ncbi:divalent-cation tolerance protein CutA [Streptomyces sp. SCSIO 30461]|uniref:divalent-cation tolerance protein CutA n=1 Tax=Streptomyces sp. SCSIO 30461 TaxID=3118085 RepID=UPI0030CD4B34
MAAVNRAETVPKALAVLTTTDSAGQAETPARGAVEARPAACTQISGPVTSVHHWQSAVETGQEWQVLFKAKPDRYDALEAHPKARHGYDTTEIIATPVAWGSAAYPEWIAAETAAPPPAGPGASAP